MDELKSLDFAELVRSRIDLVLRAERLSGSEKDNARKEALAIRDEILARLKTYELSELKQLHVDAGEHAEKLAGLEREMGFSLCLEMLDEIDSRPETEEQRKIETVDSFRTHVEARLCLNNELSHAERYNWENWLARIAEGDDIEPPDSDDNDLHQTSMALAAASKDLRNWVNAKANNGPFVYTMRKASGRSALSNGEADHRDLILTANGRLVHAAKQLGFDGVRGETIGVTRTRAAQYVIHHLVGIAGESYETIEGWSVDDALSRLVDRGSNQTDDATDALRHFLELATEIRNRIEANPDEWWKDITQLSHQLEESRKLICPDKPWGFVLTSDMRVPDSAAEHIQTQSKEHPDLDCGTISKDSTGFVLHCPSQPMTNDRKIAPDVLSMTALWTCDPYADSTGVSVVETLCGLLGGKLTDIRTPTEACEALLPLNKWIRFAESKLGDPNGFARAQSTLRSFGVSASLVSAVQMASADSWRETMAAIRSGS